MPKLEKMIEGAIFSSRWLQVPLYLGLILVLLVSVLGNLRNALVVVLNLAERLNGLGTF